MKYNTIIMGSSFGAVAAAIAAASMEQSVAIFTNLDWVGGQVSSQGVPPDEHRYIERFGSTAFYREYRERILEYYRTHMDLKETVKNKQRFNPGNGWVSQLCHEPWVSHTVLEAWLLELNVSIFYESSIIEIVTEKRKIEGVFDSKNQYYSCDFFIDASETGEALPMLNIPYTTGMEGFDAHQESHAMSSENPLAMQAVTWCFAVSLEETGDYTIKKPALYNTFKSHRDTFWPGSQLSWWYSEPHTGTPIKGSMNSEADTVNLFTYRRMRDHRLFNHTSSDITLVNWPQNDYWDGPLYGNDPVQNQTHRERSKELSKCFLYWLQTEAGYPNLKPRGDVMGTSDGFAKEPYIRESRRMCGRFTVTETMITPTETSPNQAQQFEDSVGIGYYHLDIHPTTAKTNYIDTQSLPFQIPLGAMIQDQYDNFMPGCKNISVTHIANGCYRLHPVEWNIGEVAGFTASYCKLKNVTPQLIYENPHILNAFQNYLAYNGVDIKWPYDADNQRLFRIEKP